MLAECIYWGHMYFSIADSIFLIHWFNSFWILSPNSSLSVSLLKKKNPFLTAPNTIIIKTGRQARPDYLGDIFLWGGSYWKNVLIRSCKSNGNHKKSWKVTQMYFNLFLVSMVVAMIRHRRQELDWTFQKEADCWNVPVVKQVTPRFSCKKKASDNNTGHPVYFSKFGIEIFQGLLVKRNVQLLFRHQWRSKMKTASNMMAKWYQ